MSRHQREGLGKVTLPQIELLQVPKWMHVNDNSVITDLFRISNNGVVVRSLISAECVLHKNDRRHPVYRKPDNRSLLSLLDAVEAV